MVTAMAGRTAVTIGNFDGVHLGHRALLQAARGAAGAEGRVVALAFDPHPATVLARAKAPGRLSSFRQRRACLAEAGADVVERLAPSPALLSLSPGDFIARTVDRFRPSAVVEGSDFRFGRGRSGSVDTLRELGRSHGFETIVVDPVEAALADHARVRVSSSAIRWLLRHGRVRDAATLLGRPYRIEGNVVSGARRGRTLGFPTINLATEDYVLPADGVYAGEATSPEGRVHAAAISVGTNETFDGRARTCEAHLLDYDGPVDRYQWTTRLSFGRWLRDQVRYETIDSLIAQIGRDVARVRELAEVNLAHV